MKSRIVQAGMLAIALLVTTNVAHADTAGLIFTKTHVYNDIDGGIGTIQIKVDVFNQGSTYLWQYTVTNHGFDPIPGISNGFSGFELALPLFVPDIGNITSPNSNWIVNCCSGEPVEWDIRNSAGLGIMPPGGVGVFSFTTLPRFITTSGGFFHTWEFDLQTDISRYSLTPGETGPEVPDVLRAPIPEPASLILLLTGTGGVFMRLRKKFIA
jgi:hypothetical protein